MNTNERSRAFIKDCVKLLSVYDLMKQQKDELAKIGDGNTVDDKEKAKNLTENIKSNYVKLKNIINSIYYYSEYCKYSYKELKDVYSTLTSKRVGIVSDTFKTNVKKGEVLEEVNLNLINLGLDNLKDLTVSVIVENLDLDISLNQQFQFENLNLRPGKEKTIILHNVQIPILPTVYTLRIRITDKDHNKYFNDIIKDINVSEK